MRTAQITRKTKETDIELYLNLDGNGKFCGSTQIGFFDHMLSAFCTHSGMDITLNMTGDIDVDCHHSIEDVGIVLGKAFAEAIGDKAGIARFASEYVPMDEALAFAAIDISGRSYLVFNGDFKAPMIGDYDTQMTVEFFRAFVNNAAVTLHIDIRYGENDHHKTEAVYKAAARAIKQAVKINGTEILSSKGTL